MHIISYTFTAEKLWDAMHNLRNVTTDDQTIINFALNSTNQQWDFRGAEASTGTNQDGLKVALLDYKYICRQKKCTTTKGALVWHKNAKVWQHSTPENPAWFLKLERIKNFAAENVTGIEWLKSISISKSH